jgi:hypothetical protein
MNNDNRSLVDRVQSGELTVGKLSGKLGLQNIPFRKNITADQVANTDPLLVPPKDPSFNLTVQILHAVEFGYKQREKGHNLETALRSTLDLIAE